MTTGKPLSNGDDQKAASKIPTFGSKRKNPLLKMKTQVDIGASAGGKWAARSTSKDAKEERKKREEPSAYIDVTTDSIDRHVPGNLPDPAPYVDVEGVDPLPPAYNGMTVEQWREFKRAQAAEEEEAMYMDGGIGGGFGDGDDGDGDGDGE